jgi:hypothetical protein
MTFSIRESLKFGWAHTKQHSGLLFKVLLVLFTLQVLSAIVTSALEGTLIGVLATIAIGIGGFVVGVGFTLITLRIAQGKHVEFKEIIPPMQMLWHYFAASFLVGLIIFGSVLGIVLAMGAVSIALGGTMAMFPLLTIIAVLAALMVVSYFAVRFSMVRFLVLDGVGITASLERSTKLTKGHMWKLLGFLIVLVLVNMLGMIAFLVGLLVTIPLTMIAYAHVYQKLHAHHSAH